MWDGFCGALQLRVDRAAAITLRLRADERPQAGCQKMVNFPLLSLGVSYLLGISP